ncbi:MAG: cupredoxin domain-containing protein [Candidatus Woesearchaeota archaeon]
MKPIITISIIIIAALAIIGGVFALVFMRDKGPTPPGTGNGDTINTPPTPGDMQKIILSMKNYNYYPQTITVKQGIPVRLTLDSTVAGCYRSFQIPALGVNSYSKNPAETVDFTPTTKGTFKFQCSMGMGYGTIIVE